MSNAANRVPIASPGIRDRGLGWARPGRPRAEEGPIDRRTRPNTIHDDWRIDLTTKRTITRWAGLLATTAIVVAACSTDGGASAAPSAARRAASSSSGSPMRPGSRRRRPRARSRPSPCPDSWCNYREALDTFAERTGLTLNELNPDAGSADELTAIEANKDNPGPQAPDVIDVGLSFGPEAKDKGLIRPYKVAHVGRDPGHGQGPGRLLVRRLLRRPGLRGQHRRRGQRPGRLGRPDRADYKNQVALAGDPRASNQAIQTVYASALANGGSLDDAQPGLDFWKKVVDAGQLRPDHRQRRHHRPGRDADHRPLDVQRPGQPRRGRRGRWRRPDRGRRPGSPAASPASMSRPSAPSPRIPMRPSCGWTSSIPMRARTSG